MGARFSLDKLSEVIAKTVHISQNGMHRCTSKVSRVSGKVLSLKAFGEGVDVGRGETREETVDVVKKIAQLCSAAFTARRIELQEVRSLLFGVATCLTGSGARCKGQRLRRLACGAAICRVGERCTAGDRCTEAVLLDGR